MEEQTLSSLGKFNKTLSGFIDDLKNIFGENDSDINKMEAALELTRINARLIISPFQQKVLIPHFIRNILSENINFFINYDYNEMIGDNEYAMYLFKKLKCAAVEAKDDSNTTKAMFNWFKLLMYYAFEDMGMNPAQEFKKIMA